MTAVLLALASAALFGGMTVALRLALRGLDDPGGAAVATVIPALAVSLVAAGFQPDLHGTWPFLLAGLMAPGGSQILFTLAVREVGASRTSVMVGGAPLVAVAIALVFLHEPLRCRSWSVPSRSSPAGGSSQQSATGPATCGASACCSLPVQRFSSRRATTWPARCTRTRAPGTAAAATLVAGALATAVWTRRAPTRRELTAARACRRPLRALVRLSLRGVLPRSRERRLAARRNRVAVGRRAVGPADPPHGGDGAAACRRCAARRRRRRADRRDPLAPRLGDEEDERQRDERDDETRSGDRSRPRSR